jgi:hypothetical protein
MPISSHVLRLYLLEGKVRKRMARKRNRREMDVRWDVMELKRRRENN